MTEFDIAGKLTLNGEGMRLQPYLDTATPPRWTWGIGRNLTDRPLTPEEWGHLLDLSASLRAALPAFPDLQGTLKSLDPRGGLITETEAEIFARWLMWKEHQDIAAIMTNESAWYASLDSARRAVILDMGYNMGPRWWKTWPNTVAAIARGDWKAASAGMLDSTWASQVHATPPKPSNPRGGRAWYLSQTMLTGAAPAWAADV